MNNRTWNVVRPVGQVGRMGPSPWLFPTPTLPAASGIIGNSMRGIVLSLGRWSRSMPTAGQGHRIKIGELGRMANPAFGENLSFCGTSSHLFKMFAVALVITNK